MRCHCCCFCSSPPPPPHPTPNAIQFTGCARCIFATTLGVCRPVGRSVNYRQPPRCLSIYLSASTSHSPLRMLLLLLMNERTNGAHRQMNVVTAMRCRYLAMHHHHRHQSCLSLYLTHFTIIRQCARKPESMATYIRRSRRRRRSSCTGGSSSI